MDVEYIKLSLVFIGTFVLTTIASMGFTYLISMGEDNDDYALSWVASCVLFGVCCSIVAVKYLF